MRAAGTTPTPPEATHHPHNQPPTHQNSLQAALSEETCRIEARRTTVNVQHVESLNDLVAQITHVRVRETVPDELLDRADEIELVDIAPEELLERLKAGNCGS